MIPKDTVFAAAEHITTLDELRWLYVPELSGAARKHLIVSKPRCQRLVRKQMPSEYINYQILEHITRIRRLRRSEFQRIGVRYVRNGDLARNAAFIIGERQLTQECNLEGRVFLNNYNWQKDKDGTLLANMISGTGNGCSMD